MDIEHVKSVAHDEGWRLGDIQSAHFIRFVKEDKIFDIWAAGMIRFVPFKGAWGKEIKYFHEEDIDTLLKTL